MAASKGPRLAKRERGGHSSGVPTYTLIRDGDTPNQEMVRFSDTKMFECGDVVEREELTGRWRVEDLEWGGTQVDDFRLYYVPVEE